ncbi:MAG: metalloregulator ArsR/SmtB family transcription factor [Desulfosarcinaceae bacterium]|jgi:ArsR family transcriptional regulator
MTDKEKANELDPLGKQFHDYIQRISQDRELYRMKAQVAKALAHESRLMIIEALYERDMCVGELSQLAQADQSTVSKHLSVLKNVGIVQDRKERSNKVYYHLRLPAVRGFLNLAQDVIQNNIPRPNFHAVRQASAQRGKA